METTFEDILNKRRTDNVYKTHVTVFEPRGKYQFSREDLEEFWKNYCDRLYKDKNVICGVAEISTEYIPILVDIDLNVLDTDDIGDELYTEEQLKIVVTTYQSVLKQIVLDCNEDDLKCVVLQKKPYRKMANGKTFIKHGFHLHFPCIFLSKIAQEAHLIPRVQNIISELHLFDNLGIDDINKIIDKASCKVPWLIYGARKDVSAEPYRVTKVFDANLEELKLEDAFKFYQIYNDNEELINIRGKVEYYLPRILSILPNNRKTFEIKAGLVSPLKEKIKKEKKTYVSTSSSEENMKIATKLVEMLSTERSRNRNEWMTVGWIIFNISNGSSEGFDLWCDFSSRDESSYDQDVCAREWSKMIKKDIGMGTLRHYASLDSPSEYAKFKHEQSEKYVQQSIEGSHNDIAKILYEEYGDEFVCANIQNNSWYQFRNHTWHPIEDAVTLRKKISSELVDRFFETGKKLYESFRDAEKSEQVMIQNRFKLINKMIGNLKSSPYKNNVIRECKEVFYDEKFRDKLDVNPFLIAFKNGVYDLKNNIFRAGKPEDYLSKKMDIEYKQFSEEDEAVQAIYEFLEKIFPDTSLRKYFMDVYCEIFIGGNHEKCVYFWTGEGDNGKTITQKFFDYMLGPYGIKGNTSIITSAKPPTGAANADLARTGGGVRHMTLDEPSPEENIYAGPFKLISGGDSYFVRDLFEKGKETKEIVPLFKISFICNKLPRIRLADKAVFNRIRVIPFESTFMREGYPLTYEEQLRDKKFPMDNQFSKKIPKLVEAFAWVLLEHRKKLDKKFEPDKVLAATRNYQKQNDIFRQFIEDTIIEDVRAEINIIDIYAQFKDWFKENFPGNQLPVKFEVEEYFIKSWGIPERNKKWRGYRLRTVQDDIAEGTAVIINNGDID